MTENASRPLSERTARAGAWTITGRLLSRVLDFISLLILARLLSPADFGLIAMAMPVVIIVETILELPLAAALIRVRLPSDEMFATAFTLGLLRGAAIAMLLATLGGLLAHFYGEPRLLGLMAVLSLAPVMRGLISPRMILYAQDFDLRRDFAMDVVGKLVALAASAAIAVSTGSYWAIVAGTVAGPATMMAMSYFFAPQRPSWSLSEWAYFSDFIGWNALSQLIAAFNWQVDKLLLPRFVSVADLGRFSTASDIASIPQQAFVGPAMKPLMAAFSSLDSNEALQAAYSKATGLFALVLAPLLLCAGMLAEPITLLTLGGKWAEAAPILGWLLLIGILYLPVEATNALALSLGQARLITIRTAVEFSIKAPLLLFAIAAAGVDGAIITRAAGAVSVMAVAMWSVKKLIGMRITDQLLMVWRPMAALLPPLLLLFFMKGVIHSTDHWLTLFLKTAALSSASLLLYVLTLGLFAFVTRRVSAAEAVAIRFVKHLSKRR